MKKAAVSLLFAISTLSAAMAADQPKAWQFSRAALSPFWESTTMEGESVLFVRESNDKAPEASLLFEPTKILAVRSASGETTYVEGQDYVWKPGTKQISLPAGTRIISKTAQDLRRQPGSQQFKLTHRDGNGEIMFGGSHEYHDMQTFITYTHQPGQWAGPAPKFAGDQLPKTIEKLSSKKPLTIALLGDSISTGCNASGWANAAPFQPPYQDLLVRNLEESYGTKVTLKNFAVGGTDTGWGIANVPKLIEVHPDLVILAFGMNDSSGRPAKDYQANISTMIDLISKANPDTEFILIATMLGNRDWVTLKHELFPQYRDALAQLCRKGVVLADLTSMWTEMLKHKQDRDLTGNGVNHPNDFGHRVYAQVLSALLIGGDGAKQ